MNGFFILADFDESHFVKYDYNYFVYVAILIKWLK
jgi:hypothetical protein